MSRLTSALLRSLWAPPGRYRTSRRTERALARALAAAPTVESAHEIATAAARR